MHTMLFPKIFLFRSVGHFGPENDASYKLWIHSKDFQEIFHDEMTKRYMKIILMVFVKKLLFGANEPFWVSKWHVFITLDLF